MAKRRVNVSRDHVQTLTMAAPIKAIAELVWNAVDAGGTKAEVRVRLNEMSAVQRLEVVDHGPGIPPHELEQAFGRIGDSVKPKEKLNSEGRVYHGREGKGRFKALALCPKAVWHTTYKDNGKLLTYEITVRRDDPDFFDASEPREADAKKTGTRVVLEGVDNGHLALARDDVRERLAEEFAAYLTSYPNVVLVWAGRSVQIDDLIEHREEYPLLEDEHPAGPATLLVLEWKSKPESKRLHICDPSGFSRHEIQLQLRRYGIEYTGYLKTPAAVDWDEADRFALGELDEEITSVVDAAKEVIRDHIRRRLAEQASTVVEEWKKQEIYPYAADEPVNPLSQAEREVFDVVAVQVHEQHPSFEKADLENKRLTLALIRQALESNPSRLTKILRDVVNLSEEDQEAFADLLERAPLTKLIRAGQLVANRLDTIHAFEHILFDPDWKKRLLERTQLHRLLVHELWILGEEYTLGADDEGLKDVLNKHLSILGREQLAPDVDVKLIDDTDGVPDLMLYRRRKVDRDRFEHLVVELKRPSRVLNQDDTSQIEKYAFSVSKDERFDTSRCSWEFVLLGNSCDDFVKEKASSDGLPEGCIYAKSGVRVWVRQWSDVLNDARSRYEFFREQLEIEASHAEGLQLIKRKHPHIFEGRGARRKKDLELSRKNESDDDE